VQDERAKVKLGTHGLELHARVTWKRLLELLQNERVTNIVAVKYTDWAERPGIVAGIGAAGTVVDTFVPGVGTLISLALAGLYGAWRG